MNKQSITYTVWRFTTLAVLVLLAFHPAGAQIRFDTSSSGFIENRGQVVDQNNQPNTKVKFHLSLPGLNVQLREGAFSYDTYISNTTGREESGSEMPGERLNDIITYSFHRIDICFIGANTNAPIVAEKPLPGYMNYYTSGTLESGARVNHYGRVTYKDLYPGIDLVFDARPGSTKPVEYNFIVHPGADLSAIRWKYQGSDNINLLNGKIRIHTQHGELTESIPLTYEKENGQSVELAYKSLGDGVFGFEAGAFDRENTLIIDPVPDIKWATYYGGTGAEYPYFVTTDAGGNVYMVGETNSATAIATSGTYQTTISGASDAFVAKFDASGNRLWASYYGGTGNDYGQVLARDGSGNMYLGGWSASAGLATSGAYQTAVAGSHDVFLVKFDANGSRIWATYYGGTGNDVPLGIAYDGSNVYLTGYTNSANGISSSGAHQTAIGGGAYDVMVAKFDASGARVWSTYYGGPGEDRGFNIVADANSNVYIVGSTLSTASMATSGSYQAAHAGSNDGFLVKLNAGGTRVWGTYFGGSGNDYTLAVAVDAGGNPCLTGYTASTSGIASLGASQTTLNGTQDAYIAKFDASGSRLWATYFGGNLVDDGRGIQVDASGNIVIAGFTTSSTGVATSGAYQTTFGGNRDAFVAKFNASGNQVWGSYFGGPGEETTRWSAMDPTGNIYLTGYTTAASTNIATTGAHQTTYGGGSYDGFLVGFKDLVGGNNAGINRLTNPNTYFCAGNHDVKIEIINAGTNVINSLDIAWQVDGANQTTAGISTPLPAGTTRIITLGNINFPANTAKELKIWTSLPNGIADTLTGNDTITLIRKAGLSGAYTIGGSNPSYAGFTEAVADLNTYGVCGPVVFNVASGTYNERITINQISGASSTNTILFKGAGMNSTVLTSAGTAATDMSTILLNGADCIRFRDMSIVNTGASFGAAIWMTAGADFNHFANLEIEVDITSTSANVNGIIGSGSTTGSADGATGSNNLFDSLEIKGGFHGIRMNGPNTTTVYQENNTISNSTFSDQYQYGIYLRNQTYPVVKNNRLSALRNASNFNIYLDYSANIEVANNISVAGDYAIYFNYVNRYQVNTSFASRVYNNMFSSNGSYAMYSNQSSSLKLWHNSFSADPTVGTIRFVASLSMDLHNNHLYSRSSQLTRYAMHADNVNTFSAMDYNNYYSAGGFVYIGPTDFPNLAALQAASTIFNQNSYSQDPLFASNTDLHTSINLLGKYLGIQEDIDGDFRNTITPVLGADEVNIPNNMGVTRLLSPLPAFCAGSQTVKVEIGNYGINAIDSVRVNWEVNDTLQSVIYIGSPIAQRGFLDVTLGTISFDPGENKEIRVWTSHPNGVNDSFPKNDTLLFAVSTGLSGVYTIGSGSSADYTDFGQAVTALRKLGVCSPVVFEVDAGIYNESVTITEIKGASATNTITFRGSGKANTILSFSGTSTANWVTLMLDGADHVIFRDMNISAVGSNYGIAAMLRGKADSNRFVNVAIQTNALTTSLNLVGIALTTSATDLYALAGQPGDANLFDSLEISGGYYGIYLGGQSEYVTVSNSVFTGQYIAGIYAGQQNYFTLSGNRVSPVRSGSFSYGVSVSSSSNFQVFNNSINAGGEYGLYVQMANFIGADPAFPTIVYNNMVSNSMGYAFYCENSLEVQVLHNSFKSEGNSSSFQGAVFFGSSSEIDLRNNHIRNDNPNIFALSADVGTFDQMDYNNYYSFGQFVRLNSVYANLTALRNGLPLFNQNSFSQNPYFFSSTDLHTSQFINGVYVGIDSDFDGEPRCPQSVSIGADDEDLSFANPVISQNQTATYTNFPSRFSHNLTTVSGVTFKWYVDGVYISDSVELNHVFNLSGSSVISLVAERCVYKDSTALTLTVNSGNPTFVLNGSNPDTLKVFSSYTDPGVIVTDLMGNHISAGITTQTNLDSSVLGSYEFWYYAQDSWGNNDSALRTIHVIDDVAPVINLTGTDTITVEVFSAINDPGVSATDNYYSSVVMITDSSNVNKSKVGIYTMTYTATDGSLNTGTATRWVKVVDTGLPLITLLANDTIIVKVHYPYVEPGLKVTDTYCKSGNSWEVDVYPNTSVIGDNILTYTAEDCEGNMAVPVARLVMVVDNESPVIYLNGLPVIKIQRWKPYNDAGISITDNYYGNSLLQGLAVVTSDVDVNWPGTYSVCYQVTDPSGNVSNQVCRVVEVEENISSLGNDPAFDNMSLYPNPNKGDFVLDLGTHFETDVQVVLTDVMGREVYQAGIKAGEQKISMRPALLLPGMYIVTVKANDRMKVLKVQITE